MINVAYIYMVLFITRIDEILLFYEQIKQILHFQFYLSEENINRKKFERIISFENVIFFAFNSRWEESNRWKIDSSMSSL